MTTALDVLDFVLGYFWFLPQYPLAIAQYAESQPLEVCVWIVVSIVGVIALRRALGGRWLKPFIAVWIMPALLVCGAAGVWPWPYSIFAIFGVGHCATPGSSAICLGLNLTLVYGIAALWRKWRQRKKAIA